MYKTNKQNNKNDKELMPYMFCDKSNYNFSTKTSADPPIISRDPRCLDFILIILLFFSLSSFFTSLPASQWQLVDKFSQCSAGPKDLANIIWKFKIIHQNIMWFLKYPSSFFGAHTQLKACCTYLLCILYNEKNKNKK